MPKDENKPLIVKRIQVIRLHQFFFCTEWNVLNTSDIDPRYRFHVECTTLNMSFCTNSSETETIKEEIAVRLEEIESIIDDHINGSE